MQLRQLVERAAVRTVWNHFETLGYAVKSVERNNYGWDLEAALGATTLRLEVKGTSGDQVSCELTPNGPTDFRKDAWLSTVYRE